jgi:hypothetical protein
MHTVVQRYFVCSIKQQSSLQHTETVLLKHNVILISSFIIFLPLLLLLLA